jgi:hypothetical protein
LKENVVKARTAIITLADALMLVGMVLLAVDDITRVNQGEQIPLTNHALLFALLALAVAIFVAAWPRDA